MIVIRYNEENKKWEATVGGTLIGNNYGTQYQAVKKVMAYLKGQK